MPTCSWKTIAPAVLAISFATSLPAQTLPTDAAYPNRYPPPIPQRDGPIPPRLSFEVVAETSLPGPVDGGTIELTDGKIRLPLVDRVAIVDPNREIDPQFVPSSASPIDAEPADASGWAASPDGKFRFRAHRDGRIEGQRLRRKRWRKTWTLAVGGAILARPLVTDRRVCFAALDNQVYCVRSRNGHRLWARDMDDRVSRPLTLWKGTIENGSADVAGSGLILVVPDGGAEILVLDPFDGSRVATFALPVDEGRLASQAIVTADGTIAVARQGYAAPEAAVTFLALRLPAGPESPPGEMNYNAPSASGEPDGS